MTKATDLHFDTDIIIVGGGMVGLLAATLLQSHHKIMLFDPHFGTISSSATDFAQSLSEQPTERVSAINPASQKHLELAGAWSQIAPRTYAYERMIVRDGAAQLDFDGQALHQCPMGWIIPNQQIIAALTARIDKTRCTVQPIAYDLGQNQASNLIRGELHTHEDIYRAKLIIAADGAMSPVRETLEIPFYQHNYRQHGVVATIQHDQSHQHIARQWFLGKDILAFLPLESHHSSIVWSSDNPERLLSASPAQLQAWLSEYSDSAVGKIIDSTAPKAFPLKYGRAQQMVCGQVALIGDAAHRVHPMAGLGVNLGFGDAGCLADTLHKGCNSSALARFARVRQLENLKIQNGIDALHRSFQLQNPALKVARQLGIQALNRLPLLKNTFARAASGR